MALWLLVAALILVILGLTIAPSVLLWFGVALGVIALALFLSNRA